MYPIVSNHYKVIVSMRELAAEVGKNIHSDSYAQVLGEMLPSSEQQNLYLDGDSAENFTELDKVYRKLKDCSLRWILQAPEPETDQTTSGTQESNKAERTQTLTNDREKCPGEPEALKKPKSDSYD